MMMIYNKLILTYLINRVVEFKSPTDRYADIITFSLRNYLRKEVKSDDLYINKMHNLLLNDNMTLSVHDFQDDMCEMMINNYNFYILFYEYGRIKLAVKTYSKNIEFEYHINSIDSQNLKIIDPNDVTELQRKPQEISKILNMIDKNKDVIYLFYRMYIELKHNFIYDKNNA